MHKWLKRTIGVIVALAIIGAILWSWMQGLIPYIPWFPGRAKVTTDKTAYNQGDTINWTATGFPANATLQVSVSTPSGLVALTGSPVSTNSAGTATASFTAGSNLVGADQLQVSTPQVTAKSGTFTVT